MCDGMQTSSCWIGFDVICNNKVENALKYDI